MIGNQYGQMKTDLSLVAVMVCYGMLWYDMKADEPGPQSSPAISNLPF